jgi:hypothetical protein
MPYNIARSNLISKGWKPVQRMEYWRMSANANYFNNLRKQGIIEFWGCSGVSSNICKFYFVDSKKNFLEVLVNPQGGDPSSRTKVYQWKINTNPEPWDF